MRETISVILVNYNGREFNNKCIESILGSTVSDSIRIIVVDNHSTDGSLEELRSNWGGNEKITIIPLDDNYGFSRANNEGIKWSIENGIHRFLLLNNDTEIEPDTIEKMCALQEEKHAIIVPKVCYFDRRDVIWCAGGSFSKIIRKARHDGADEKDSAKFNKDRRVRFANGCALLLNKDIIDKMGLLDERFFLYYEDTEYSLRAEEAGIPIWYCAGAKVYHKVNGSTKGISKPANDYYISRNWLLCNSIHIKGISKPVFKSYYFINRSVWSLICLLTGRGENVKAVRKGISDHKKGIYGPCPHEFTAKG